MTSFCVVEDVKAIVDTDIADGEIDILIEECGALIEAKVGTTPNASILRAINRTWVAYRCMLKDPESQALGEYRHDRSMSLQLMRQDYLDWLKIAGGGIAFSYSYERLPRSYIAIG